MIIPPLLPLIEKDLSLSHGEAALLMSVYMFPYALMQLPAGTLSDRFGKKYFIVLSVFGTCLTTILMAFASTFESLLVLRIISGLTAGMFYAPSTAYVVQSAGGRDVSMALGLVFTGGSFSNIVISILVNFLPIAEYSWRSFFILCAVPGAIFAPSLLLLLPPEKVESAGRKNLDFGSFRREMKNIQLDLLLLYNFVSSLSGWSLMTFLPTFYVLERGFTVSEASLLMIIYYITSAMSGPLSGITTNILGLRAPSIISALAICAVSYTIPLSSSPATTLSILVIWGLLGGLSWSAYNVLLSELIPQGFQGTFLGIYNLTGFLSGTIGPILFGKVADLAGFEAFFTLALFLNMVPLGISIIIMRFQHISPIDEGNRAS